LIYELGKYNEALPFYDRTLRIEPNNQRAIFYRSQILKKLKQNENDSSFLNKLRKKKF